MAVQLQWSLDSTVGSALSVARGIFLAANNDNVQPLAIASCEKFGNTIAMCQETCRKIESLTARTPEPVVINFLRAYAGFDAADSATQLSKSQAGVQFLGLAAALVTSLGAFEGGNMLHKMLGSSASDKTLLPTARQLKDLLLSLEPRLQQSGFMNTVIGWHVFLGQSHVVTRGYQMDLRLSNHFPGPEAMDSLVDAFRKLSRIGESDITRVSIQTTDCASWVIAFTKWCLGLPPSIYLDDGTLVLKQPGTKVNLIMARNTDTNAAIKVSVHRAMGAPSELVEAQSGRDWTGMVTVKEYGQWRLYNLRFDTGTAKEALLQALPFAIRHLIQSLRFSDCHARLDGDLVALGLVPFPEEHIVAQTMSLYLSSSAVTILRSLDGLRLEDLPVMKLHLKTLKETCSCASCSSLGSRKFRPCRIDEFSAGFACICADILALSLFRCSETPLLHLGNFLYGKTAFEDAIQSGITSGTFSSVKISDLLHHTLELTGHKFLNSSGDETSWVISSFKGQVIYPTLYETLSYEKEGYLTLNWLPGILRYNGEVYDRVLALPGSISTTSTDYLRSDSGATVTKPLNHVPNLKLVWLVDQGDNILTVSLGLKGQGDDFPVVRYQPNMVFETLASALLLEACAHDPGAELESPDTFCTSTGPLAPLPLKREKNGVWIIGVVAVDGSDDMRFLSLANGEPLVLRKKACLSCCLDVCRRASYPAVVL